MNHRDLVEQSLEELRIKTAAYDGLFHIGTADWSIDQEAGEIVFQSRDGRTATCAVQIIGTFNTDDSTWLWGWDHPSILTPLRHHALRVREHGEAHRIEELTTRKVPATEEQCWEFTALACKLNEAQGGFRGSSGTAWVYVTFDTPALSIDPERRRAALDDAEEENEEEEDFADDEAGSRPIDDSGFASEIPEDVRATVEGFIEALRDWEVAAFQASQDELDEEAYDRIQEAYHAVLQEWCAAGLTSHGHSYGSDAGNTAERLVAFADDDETCRVRTERTTPSGYVSRNEYHLRREEGRWRIENQFSLDEDEGVMWELL